MEQEQLAVLARRPAGLAPTIGNEVMQRDPEAAEPAGAEARQAPQQSRINTVLRRIQDGPREVAGVTRRVAAAIRRPPPTPRRIASSRAQTEDDMIDQLRATATRHTTDE